MQTNGCLTNKHFQNEQAVFVCSAEIWAASAAGDRQKVTGTDKLKWKPKYLLI